MSTKKTDEELLSEIIKTAEELGWDVLIMMDESKSIPAIIVGTPRFIRESKAAIDDMQQDSPYKVAETIEGEPLDIVNDQTEVPPIEKKKTFH